MNFLDDSTYVEWNKVRFGWLLNKYGSGYFQGKTILELGAGSGALGQKFARCGAKVTCVEGRFNHVRSGRKLYPKLKFVHMNLEKKGELLNLGKFDIVIHFGTLYHLKNYESNLREALQLCRKVMFLETEVMDSTEDEVLMIEENKKSPDQAISGFGAKPSPANVERIIRSCGFRPKVQLDAKLNLEELHVYDWELQNSKAWKPGRRRFWVVTKND